MIDQPPKVETTRNFEKAFQTEQVKRKKQQLVK